MKNKLLGIAVLATIILIVGWVFYRDVTCSGRYAEGCYRTPVGAELEP